MGSVRASKVECGGCGAPVDLLKALSGEGKKIGGLLVVPCEYCDRQSVLDGLVGTESSREPINGEFNPLGSWFVSTGQGEVCLVFNQNGLYDRITMAGDGQSLLYRITELKTELGRWEFDPSIKLLKLSPYDIQEAHVRLTVLLNEQGGFRLCDSDGVQYMFRRPKVVSDYQ